MEPGDMVTVVTTHGPYIGQYVDKDDTTITLKIIIGNVGFNHTFHNEYIKEIKEDNIHGMVRDT